METMMLLPDESGAAVPKAENATDCISSEVNSAVNNSESREELVIVNCETGPARFERQTQNPPGLDTALESGNKIGTFTGFRCFIRKTSDRDTYRIIDVLDRDSVDKQLVMWLRSNFEEKAGQILRHNYVYERYLLFAGKCGKEHDEVIDASCFRQVVRAVFSGLSNRCFGRKGGSKNDYFGLQTTRTNLSVAGSAFSSNSVDDTSLAVLPSREEGNLPNQFIIGDNIWTADEIKAFGRAIARFGKDFPLFTGELPPKTVKNCVEFYYWWKKRFPQDYQVLKQSKRKVYMNSSRAQNRQ